jgi:hypothetical protein
MASMAKLPKAADDVDQAGLAPYGEGRVERLGVDELVAQDLRGERVEQLLVCVREVRHLLAYAIMAGLLVGVYAGLVLLTIQVFRVRTPVAVAVSTPAAAAAFNPLRLWRAVDRRSTGPDMTPTRPWLCSRRGWKTRLT